MSSVNDLVKFNIPTGYFYTLIPEGVRFLNPAIGGETSFRVPEKTAMLSTSLSFNLVPSSIQSRFFKLLLKDVDYWERDAVFYTSCDTWPADVEIMVQGHWIKFAGADMVIDTRIEDTDEYICIINFLANKDDYWVFGQAFYTDYYVIHEPTLGWLGIAPTEKRLKPPVEAGELPKMDINSPDALLVDSI